MVMIALTRHLVMRAERRASSIIAVEQVPDLPIGKSCIATRQVGDLPHDRLTGVRK